ncbi:MAG: tail fiber domain-containing protein [Bacteroidetes bacterium]|nr:tail fiber domain-containing protein [Bacteroidota bacterium]
MSINSDLVPTTNCARSIGNSTNRWNIIYACNGVINTSDARDKIAQLKYGIKEIMKMNPVSYQWNYNQEDGTKLGLLAQDLQKIVPEVVRDWEYKTDEITGERTKIPAEQLGVFYSDLIPVLIKGMQEQQTEIKLRDSRIVGLEDRLTQMEKDLSQCCLSHNEKATNTDIVVSDIAKLEQNAPNPFNQNTTIKVYIPAKTVTAKLMVYSATGQTVKTVDIQSKGLNTITIEGSELQSGIYNYTLFIDGLVIDSKQMILTK